MYEVRLSHSAEKLLDNLHRSNRGLFRRLMRALDELSRNPSGGKALLGNLRGYYSFRVGDYRILLEIDKAKRIVYVERIEHRSIIYKRS